MRLQPTNPGLSPFSTGLPFNETSSERAGKIHKWPIYPPIKNMTYSKHSKTSLFVTCTLLTRCLETLGCPNPLKIPRKVIFQRIIFIIVVERGVKRATSFSLSHEIMQICFLWRPNMGVRDGRQELMPNNYMCFSCPVIPPAPLERLDQCLPHLHSLHTRWTRLGCTLIRLIIHVDINCMTRGFIRDPSSSGLGHVLFVEAQVPQMRSTII